MSAKWYSIGLSSDEARRIGPTDAKIKDPVIGIDDSDQLALQFGLVYRCGSIENCKLTDWSDISELLRRTKAYKIPKLEGKFVEAYIEGSQLRGLSLNEDLMDYYN
jgi:hypothetical protein